MMFMKDKYLEPTCPECDSTDVDIDDNGIAFYTCNECGYESSEDEDEWIRK